MLTDEQLEEGKKWLMGDKKAVEDLAECIRAKQMWVIQLWFYCRYGKPKEIE